MRSSSQKGNRPWTDRCKADLPTPLLEDLQLHRQPPRAKGYRGSSALVWLIESLASGHRRQAKTAWPLPAEGLAEMKRDLRSGSRHLSPSMKNIAAWNLTGSHCSLRNGVPKPGTGENLRQVFLEASRLARPVPKNTDGPIESLHKRLMHQRCQDENHPWSQGATWPLSRRPKPDMALNGVPAGGTNWVDRLSGEGKNSGRKGCSDC